LKYIASEQERDHLARISHHSSTVAALCGIPDDFHSVRALNSVSTMPAHSSVAKDTWDTTFHRLTTKGGEKCELVNGGQSLYIGAISAKRFRHQKKARTRRAFQVSE
jgi:hypothetical protein